MLGASKSRGMHAVLAPPVRSRMRRIWSASSALPGASPATVQRSARAVPSVSTKSALGRTHATHATATRTRMAPLWTNMWRQRATQAVRRTPSVLQPCNLKRRQRRRHRIASARTSQRASSVSNGRKWNPRRHQTASAKTTLRVIILHTTCHRFLPRHRTACAKR